MHYGFTELKLKERLINNPLGFSTIRNNFLYHLYEDVTQYLSAAGIPQWMIKVHLEWWSHPNAVNPKGPQVLSINDLSFGFFIWLMTMGLSTAAFGFEFLIYSFGKIFVKFLGLILFLRSWKNFIN